MSHTGYLKAANNWAEGINPVAEFLSGRAARIDPADPNTLQVVDSDGAVEFDGYTDLADVYRDEHAHTEGCAVCLLGGDDGAVRWAGDPEGHSGVMVCDTCHAVEGEALDDFEAGLQEWVRQMVADLASRRPV